MRWFHCFIVSLLHGFIASLLFTGCSTSVQPGEGMMNAYIRKMNHRRAAMMYRGAPFFPPAVAGGCDKGNPLAICLKNTTDEYQARCLVSEAPQPYLTHAGPVVAPIVTGHGIAPAYLIPPQREVPVFIQPSSQAYLLRCELFRGAPPYDAPPYIVTHRMSEDIRYNGQEGRTFHLHPDFMRSAQGLPAN